MFPEEKQQSARDIIAIIFNIFSNFIVSVKLTASMLIMYKLTYKDPGLTQ